MKVTYDSNNSGGSWWLSDDDWFALEKDGWDVDWYAEQKETMFWSMMEDGRWLGALASKATVEVASVDEAIERWERITGQDHTDEGCSCCGQPHNFWED